MEEKAMFDLLINHLPSVRKKKKLLIFTTIFSWTRFHSANSLGEIKINFLPWNREQHSYGYIFYGSP